MVECDHIFECYSKNTYKCIECKHNTKRHYVKDFFEKAEDNEIPERCPRLTYDGPIEQTSGYLCPVCGHHTNPYQLVDGNCCKHCGYRLNVGEF